MARAGHRRIAQLEPTGDVGACVPGTDVDAAVISAV